jgi:redox-sensitive bicupin YhaK (pirin superfamily)
MSYLECPSANVSPSGCNTIEMVVVPRTSDLGGFEVARVLPCRDRRAVGPFVFLDQMGPSTFGPGQGVDVRPHPHIGLATVTYLYQGEIMHRDSLGFVQPIRPGELNWMTAGRGIVHSERTPDALRSNGSPLSGMQAWVALPRAHEETEPGFIHHASGAMPTIEDGGARVRVIAGTLFVANSPVATMSETIYADVELAAGASLPFDSAHEERGLYLFSGAVNVDGRDFDAGRLLVLKPGTVPRICATAASRLLILGGEPLDGPRFVWWNFVSSRRERIEQAKADWKAGRFDPVPGETESIPLPE